jgi:hypothetical protein
MKERHCGRGEFALRPGILHARIAGGKVKAMGYGPKAPLHKAETSVHEPVPPTTTGIVRART